MTARPRRGQSDERTPAGGQPRRRRAAVRSSRGAELLVVLVALVGGLHALAMIGVEAYRIVTTHREVTRLEADVARLEREAEELRAVIEHGDDERYREALARRLGFVYPDEQRVVRLPAPPPEDAPAAP